MVGKMIFCSKFPDTQKNCGEEGEEKGQEVSWNTSVCSVKAVLFKNSCKTIYGKLQSLIKIQSCFVLCSTEAATKGLLCNIVVLKILAKPLKKSVKVHVFLVKLQTVGHKRIFSLVYYNNLAKTLVTLSNIVTRYWENAYAT